MMCEHKNLKSENCRIFCIDCGLELPPEVLKNRAEQHEDQKNDIEKPKRKKGSK